MKRYNFFLFALIATCSVFSYAQKIVVGTYTFKDGAVYTGDLFNGKPNGGGRMVTYMKATILKQNAKEKEQ